MSQPTCDICPKLSTETRISDETEMEFHACDEHRQHLAGWVCDHESECSAEGMAARAQSEAEMDYYAGYE